MGHVRENIQGIFRDGGLLDGTLGRRTDYPQRTRCPSKDLEVYVLHVKSGPLSGRQIDVDGELTIGRENADISIDDPEISRRHALVREREGAAEIEDLGSLNGTIVNHLSVRSATRLEVGDLVEVGGTILEVGVREEDPGRTLLRDRRGMLEQAPREAPTRDASPNEAPEKDTGDLTRAPPAPAPVPEVPALSAEPQDGVGPAESIPPRPEAGRPATLQDVRFTHSGQRFLLGETSEVFGIWDRLAPDSPAQLFPRTEEGWASAWQVYSAWEPQAVDLGAGAGGQPGRGAPFQQPFPTSARPEPLPVATGPRKRPGGVTAAGILLIVAGALEFLLGFFLLSQAPDIADSAGVSETLVRTLALIDLVLGGVRIFSGIGVLRGSRLGWIVGIAVSGVAMLLGVFSLITGQGSAAIGIVLAVLPLSLLLRNARHFKR